MGVSDKGDYRFMNLNSNLGQLIKSCFQNKHEKNVLILLNIKYLPVACASSSNAKLVFNGVFHLH